MHLFLKYTFSVYTVLAGELGFFSCLTLLLHCLVTSIIATEKRAVSKNFVPFLDDLSLLFIHFKIISVLDGLHFPSLCQGRVWMYFKFILISVPWNLCIYRFMAFTHLQKKKANIYKCFVLMLHPSSLQIIHNLNFFYFPLPGL